MIFPPDYIRSIVEKAAAVLNFTEWNYSEQKFESIGQNYFGDLIPVVLNGKINGEQACARLVLKLAPTDERYRVSGAVSLMFAREIFLYSTLLAQYRIQETSTTRFVFPECYYVCKEYCREAIVMKDMCADGYEPYTKGIFLDLEHMRVSLQALARFHAHSFILHNRNSALYEEAQSACVPLTLASNKRYMEVMEDRLNKALVKFENTEYEAVFEKLKQKQVPLIEATSKAVRKTCVCHGDLWKENILFKYDNNMPLSACIIDYQTARMSCPAYDVLYLITSSTDSTQRRLRFKSILDIYYKELSNILKETGLNVDDEYSRISFEEDLKTVGPACVIVTNTAVWLASGLQQEGHVRSKIALSTKEDMETAIETYKKRMKDIIDDFITYGYL